MLQECELYFVLLCVFFCHFPSQGRLPIRVQLKGLTEEDMYRILTEPVNNLIRQQVELMKTEQVCKVQTCSTSWTAVVLDCAPNFPSCDGVKYANRSSSWKIKQVCTHSMQCWSEALAWCLDESRLEQFVFFFLVAMWWNVCVGPYTTNHGGCALLGRSCHTSKYKRKISTSKSCRWMIEDVWDCGSEKGRALPGRTNHGLKKTLVNNYVRRFC